MLSTRYAARYSTRMETLIARAWLPHRPGTADVIWARATATVALVLAVCTTVLWVVGMAIPQEENIVPIFPQSGTTWLSGALFTLALPAIILAVLMHRNALRGDDTPHVYGIVMAVCGLGQALLLTFPVTLAVAFGLYTWPLLLLG